MLGREGVSAALVMLLSDNIAAEVAVCTEINGALPDGTGVPEVDGDPVDAAAIAQLVVPQLISPTPPADIADVAVGDWPFIAVDVRQVPRSTPAPASRPGVNPGAVQGYLNTYLARLVFWVRGNGYLQTGCVRDRLMLVGRQTILRHRTLLANDVGPVGVLLEATLAEEYVPVGLDPQLEATVAAGMIQAQWRVTENLPDVPSTAGPVTVGVTIGRTT